MGKALPVEYLVKDCVGEEAELSEEYEVEDEYHNFRVTFIPIDSTTRSIELSQVYTMDDLEQAGIDRRILYELFFSIGHQLVDVLNDINNQENEHTLALEEEESLMEMPD